MQRENTVSITDELTVDILKRCLSMLPPSHSSISLVCRKFRDLRAITLCEDEVNKNSQHSIECKNWLRQQIFIEGALEMYLEEGYRAFRSSLSHPLASAQVRPPSKILSGRKSQPPSGACASYGSTDDVQTVEERQPCEEKAICGPPNRRRHRRQNTVLLGTPMPAFI